MNAPIKMPFQNWMPDTATYYAGGEVTAQNCLPTSAVPNYSQVNSIALSAIGQPNAGTYVTNAVEFANAPYMIAASNLTGITNTKTLTFSIWCRIDANIGTEELIIIEGPSDIPLDIHWVSNQFQISGTNSGGTQILWMYTSASYSPGTTWYNLLGSVNLATGATNLYVNNVSDNVTVTSTNDTLSYASAGNFCYVGAAKSGGSAVNFLDGALSEFWLDTSFFDLSIAGNRAKFISAGLPVNLGSTGQTPTGSSPILYLKNPASTFYTNSGTGGNFTVTGSLAIASSSPSGSTPSQFLGAFSCIDSSDVPHTYCGTSSQLVEITSVAATNVSKSGGYTASNWEFAAFTAAGINNVYATDYTDNIQVMAIGGTVFADLAGSPPKAKHIGTIGQFVVAGNTNGGTYAGGTAGAVPNRFWWPQIGTPTSWPDPLTLTGIADQAGVEDLPLVYGAIQHISNGEFFGIIFQEHGLTNAYYVGGNAVFEFNTYEMQRGCYCPNAVVQVGLICYFIDQSGFFETDGARVEPIGHDQVDKTWLADVNTAYLSNVRGSHDASNKCIWWTYPSLSATLLGGFVVCDKVIVYNYADKRWAMGMVGQSIDILFSSYTLAYTMEQLDSVNSNLDLITPSLDSPFWNGGQPVVGVFGIAQIGSSGSYASYSGSISGPALTALIDTKEVQLNPGGLSMVNAINPVVMGATLSSIQVAMGTRNTLSAAVAFDTLTSPETRTGKVSKRSNARYHRARVQISGGFTNAMGVEPEATPAGQA